MKEFISVFVVLIGIFGAFVLGRKFPDVHSEFVSEKTIEDGPAEKLKKCEDSSEALKKKLSELTENDLEAIASTENPNLRQQKIEALLSKVVQLFIVDLGLRIQNPLATKVEDTKLSFTKAVDTKAEDKKPLINELTKIKTGELAGAEADDAKPDKASIRKQIQKLANVADVSEVPEALAATARANIYDDFKSAARLSNNQIRSLEGKWVGEVTNQSTALIDPINLELQKGSKANEFRYLVQIKKGTGTRRSSGSGALKDWLSIDGEIFVQISGDYISLVYDHNLDQWFGHYYQKRSVSTYQPIGTVALSRN